MVKGAARPLRGRALRGANETLARGTSAPAPVDRVRLAGVLRTPHSGLLQACNRPAVAFSPTTEITSLNPSSNTRLASSDQGCSNRRGEMGAFVSKLLGVGRRFVADCTGAAMVEYTLLVGIVTAAILVAIGVIALFIATRWGDVGSALP